MTQNLTAQEIEDVKRYLGQGLCQQNRAVVESQPSPDLTCWFRVVKGADVLHNLTLYDAVFDDLRRGKETIGAFLDRKRVAETMREAGPKRVWIRSMNGLPSVDGDAH